MYTYIHIHSLKTHICHRHAVVRCGLYERKYFRHDSPMTCIWREWSTLFSLLFCTFNEISLFFCHRTFYEKCEVFRLLYECSGSIIFIVYMYHFILYTQQHTRTFRIILFVSLKVYSGIEKQRKKGKDLFILTFNLILSSDSFASHYFELSY